MGVVCPLARARSSCACPSLIRPSCWRGSRAGCGPRSSARRACVGIFNIITVHKTVVSILITLQGSGITWGLRCTRPTKTIPGRLLVASTITATASTSISSPAVVGRVLVLCRGVDVAWGCWLTAMQNCWMFASWPCIAARLAACLCRTQL